MLQLKGAGEQEGRIQAPQRGPGGLSTEGRREGVRKSMFRDLGNTLMIHAQVLGLQQGQEKSQRILRSWPVSTSRCSLRTHLSFFGDSTHLLPCFEVILHPLAQTASHLSQHI